VLHDNAGKAPTRRWKTPAQRTHAHDSAVTPSLRLLPQASVLRIAGFRWLQDVKTDADGRPALLAPPLSQLLGAQLALRAAALGTAWGPSAWPAQCRLRSACAASLAAPRAGVRRALCDAAECAMAAADFALQPEILGKLVLNNINLWMGNARVGSTRSARAGGCVRAFVDACARACVEARMRTCARSMRALMCASALGQRHPHSRKAPPRLHC
jgi:hypothetical protein